LLLASGEFAFLAVAFMLRAGTSLARNMGSAQLGRMVSPAEIGLAYGIAETIPTTVLTLAPLAAGFLYAQAPALPFQVSLVLGLISIGLAWRLAPRRDAQSADPAPGGF